MDYKITLPTKKYISHPKIEALKGIRIGPIFPEEGPTALGMRGVKDSHGLQKDWMTYREKRRKRNRIASHSRVRNRA